jgi:hypothetical protein
MIRLTRREVMEASLALLTWKLLPVAAVHAEEKSLNKKIPVIHVTDCFRPHRDPDDHWDLATVYALAYLGYIDLKGVVLDAPWKWKAKSTPDVMAVAQMNRITGLSVPAIAGTPEPLKHRKDLQKDLPREAHGAARFIQRVLRNSEQPVVINFTGTSTDVALAALKEPDLFASKSPRVYINSGIAAREESEKGVSHNIAIDPAAYAAIFDMACPLYWAPCSGGFVEGEVRLQREYPEFWRKAPDIEVRPIQKHSSWYRFKQDEVLPHLSPRVQNFFAYMFEFASGPDWLQYIEGQVKTETINNAASKFRNMWSTAAILHGAGLTVSKEGEIISAESSGSNALYTFDSIDVTCDDRGVTSWKPSPESQSKFILNIRDTSVYVDSMIKALKSLLVKLP